MKNKNHLFLAAGAILYSSLFYQERPGINFLLFNLFLIAYTIIRDKSLIKSPYWLATACGSLISATAILLYGNYLAVFANMISLALVSIYALNINTSLLLSLIHSIYSIIKSPFKGIYEMLNYWKGNKTGALNYAMISVVPLLIVVAFAILYRQGNPLFKNLTDHIDLSFIETGWIAFTLGGVILMYVFINPQLLHSANVLDYYKKDDLYPDKYQKDWISNIIKNQNLSGIILLTLLNALLILVNAVDINYLFIEHELPAGLSYSEYIHEGVYTIIVSVLSAIAVILYYFRGNLNFYSRNQSLRILTLAWLAQNGITVLLAVFKNTLYINEYALTYKRIGVFVYLTLTIIGLVITLLKITQVKSNWFLIRKNSWAFYGVLLLACLVNWDLLIVRHNLNSKNPDYNYLISLGASSIPDLMKVDLQNIPYSEEGSDFVYELQEATHTFEYLQQKGSWLSFNFEDRRISKALSEKK